jgi:DHA1 family bicyclomycin/chloramphenicol resistance-like MFS transporter
MSFPNTTALALAPHGRVAGSAAAVLGCLQFAIGGIGGALVSMLDNGTAMPMVGTIAAGGVLAFLTNRFFSPKDAPHIH